MRQSLTIKAVPGRTVHDPEDNSPVTDSTKTVPDSFFWRRRLSAGDVAEVVPTAKKTIQEEPTAESESPATGKKSK